MRWNAPLPGSFDYPTGALSLRSIATQVAEAGGAKDSLDKPPFASQVDASVVMRRPTICAAPERFAQCGARVG